MAEIEHLNEQRNLARIEAGLRGGDLYKSPVLVPERTIVDATPPGVDEKLGNAPVAQGRILDSWVTRRPNSSMK